MSVDRFSPALRRAIIKACPLYFGLSPIEQEAFRAKLSDEDEFLIEQQVYVDLFGISVSDFEEMREAHRELSPSDVNLFNETILPLKGIGDDCFWFNEFGSDEAIRTFETLYEFDRNDYEFQENSREKASPDYIKKPYRGSFYASWARVFVDDVFTYVILYCTAGYLIDEIEDHGSNTMDRLIPHRYVRGKNDGKPEKGGFLSDIQLEANGKEEQYEELRDRFWAYYKQRHEELLDLWDKRADGQAWIIDETTPDDPAMTFVFSDKTALQNVRMRDFISDCRSMKGQAEVLSAACQEERDRITAYLEEQYANIKANFDPKIRKFRKRRKVIMAPEAVDDLNNLLE